MYHSIYQQLVNPRLTLICNATMFYLFKGDMIERVDLIVSYVYN
jgi:hypothetical protein